MSVIRLTCVDFLNCLKSNALYQVAILHNKLGPALFECVGMQETCAQVHSRTGRSARSNSKLDVLYLCCINNRFRQKWSAISFCSKYLYRCFFDVDCVYLKRS